jgi:hypothetical protein
MTAEEFAQWTVMIDEEWIGPARQSRLLAHIAAGVRNGQIQGPDGKDSLWTVDNFIPPDRWEPPKAPLTLKQMKAQVRQWFQRMAYAKKKR